MNVLVTGGFGLIGVNLVKKLLEKYLESNVTIVDDLSTQDRYCKDDFNFNELKEYLNFDEHLNRLTFCFDSTEEVELERNVYDVIFYLASPASPEYFFYDPNKVIKSNVDGLRNVIESQKFHLKKLFFASSSEVYGYVQSEEELPLREDKPLKIKTASKREVYAISKLLGENVAFTYGKEYNFEVKIGRIFNTYGYPNYNDGRFIPNLIRAIEYNEPMDLYGRNIKRSFCYVTDLVDQIIEFTMINDDKHILLNLGNDDVKRLEDVMEIASKIIGKKIPYEYKLKARQETDPQVRQPDLTFNHMTLKSRPKVSLEEGLKEVFKHEKIL